MGALLESGMVGNIGLKHLRVIKEDTIRKWDDLGFLEDWKVTKKITSRNCTKTKRLI